MSFHVLYFIIFARCTQYISFKTDSRVQDIFSGGLYQKDALTEFFDEIRQRSQFKYWFFGHYHEDMVIEKKYVMLYEQIIRPKL